MEESVHLASRHQLLNRLTLKHLAVVGNGIDCFWIEDEKSAIDPPTLVGGLLLKRINLGVF
jgi:hypothetical protein